jgi:hypothetical protein
VTVPVGLVLLALAGLSVAIGDGCGRGAPLEVDAGAFQHVAGPKCPGSDAGTQTDALTVSNDPRCPSAWSDISPNLVCSTDGILCLYPEGQAECALNRFGFITWSTIDAEPGCALTSPKVGSACAVPGATCWYISGRPSVTSADLSSSGFLTGYCCDGNSCAWTAQGDGGCPNGNTCGAIKGSDYDQSCTVDTDCVAVSEGDFCATAHICPNTVINIQAEAQYAHDLRSKLDGTKFPGPCPAGPPVVCDQGRCTFGGPGIGP